MGQTPRASFSISILDDEDFAVLVEMRYGLEAFGAFAALVILMRERLYRGQVRRSSETQNGTFDNSLTHVRRASRLSKRQLNRAIETFSALAEETKTGPWLFLDETDHLVIRSYFKYNNPVELGGARPGAGRPRTRNQVDSSKTINSKSTRIVSVSSSKEEEKTPSSPHIQDPGKPESRTPEQTAEPPSIRDVRTPEQKTLCEPGPETPVADPPGTPPPIPLPGKCSPAEVEHLRGLVRQTNRDVDWDIRVQQWALSYEHRDIVDAVLDTPPGAPPNYAAKTLRSIERDRVKAEKESGTPKSSNYDKPRIYPEIPLYDENAPFDKRAPVRFPRSAPHRKSTPEEIAKMRAAHPEWCKAMPERGKHWKEQLG